MNTLTPHTPGALAPPFSSARALGRAARRAGVVSAFAVLLPAGGVVLEVDHPSVEVRERASHETRGAVRQLRTDIEACRGTIGAVCARLVTESSVAVLTINTDGRWDVVVNDEDISPDDAILGLIEALVAEIAEGLA